MRRASSVTLGLLLVLLPVSLAAQTIPSPYRFIETRHSIGLYAGQLLADEGELELGPQAAPVIGARYDIHFTGPLSGEVALGFSPSQRTIFIRSSEETGGEIVQVGDTDMRLLMGEAGLRFHLTGPRAWHGIAPYGLVTGGFALNLSGSDSREAPVQSEQRFQFGPAFAVGVGLGSDFYLTERLSLRAEARDYLWRLTYPASLTEEGQRRNEWQHNIALTIGAAVHF